MKEEDIRCLMDCIQKMLEVWKSNHHSEPDIVMECSPEYYLRKLRAAMPDALLLYRTRDDVNFIEIMGLKVPVVIVDDMDKNCNFCLKFRKDYERQEIEKLFNKFSEMWRIW